MIASIVAVICVIATTYFILREKRHPVVADMRAMADCSAILQESVVFYRRLDDANKKRFAVLVDNFMKGVTVEGVGTEVTDTDRVLIGASAVIPIFGFPDWRYENLTNVILYPDTFDTDFQFEGNDRNILGMVGTGYMNGQMLLSRKALIQAYSKTPGNRNTAVHEFVHLLDKSDGITDGLPENFLEHQYVAAWVKTIGEEMKDIEKGHSDINPYALTNKAEFFAVVSEYFFEQPDHLRQHHTELYDQLCRIFHQSPATGEPKYTTSSGAAI